MKKQRTRKKKREKARNRKSLIPMVCMGVKGKFLKFMHIMTQVNKNTKVKKHAKSNKHEGTSLKRMHITAIYSRRRRGRRIGRRSRNQVPQP